MEKRTENSNRPRPIIVRMEQDHEPWIILRNGRRLNDEENEVFKRIRIAKDLIAKDLTPKQRELYN